jgi:hypothetical protein
MAVAGWEEEGAVGWESKPWQPVTELLHTSWLAQTCSGMVKSELDTCWTTLGLVAWGYWPVHWVMRQKTCQGEEACIIFRIYNVGKTADPGIGRLELRWA